MLPQPRLQRVILLHLWVGAPCGPVPEVGAAGEGTAGPCSGVALSTAVVYLLTASGKALEAGPEPHNRRSTLEFCLFSQGARTAFLPEPCLLPVPVLAPSRLARNVSAVS